MPPISSRGFLVLLILTICSVPTFFVTLWPAIPLAIISLMISNGVSGGIQNHPKFLLKFFNFWFDTVQGLWIALLVMLLECVLQLRIAYTIVSHRNLSKKSTQLQNQKQIQEQLAEVFKPAESGKFKIIILNHRCRIDWMMMFPFLLRAGALQTLRIVLKIELSRVPIFGWSMQLFRYIFLSRKWANDKENMRHMITHHSKSGGATILIFPEGTDLSPSNINKSNAYAAENGLPQFRHVLNPRSTGIIAMKNMIGVENIEEIVDITMGYTDFIAGERPCELSIVNGRMPKKVHILCTRHHFKLNNEKYNNQESNNENKEYEYIPSDDEGFHLWLNDRFAKKEVILSQFYASNPVGFEKHHLQNIFGQNSTISTYDEDEDAVLNPTSTKFSRFLRDVGIWRGFIAVILYWICLLLVWVFYGGILMFIWAGGASYMCWWATMKKGGLIQWLLLNQKELKEKEEKVSKKD